MKKKKKNWGIHDWIRLDIKTAKSYIIIKTHFGLLLEIRTLLVFSEQAKKILQCFYSSLSRKEENISFCAFYSNSDYKIMN